MKRWTNLNATALLLLGLLAGPTSVARAGRDEIIVHEGGITFRVARYDDGRKKPYLLKFWASGVKTSKYRFKQDGRVGSIKAGTEKYSVWHKRNGSFKKVVRKDAGGRMLLGDENAEENQQIDQGGIDEGGQAVQFEHRRLYACDDCDEAWDIVCNVGVPTICNLRDNETLGTKGDSSVAIACETFGIACSKLSADEACDGQCIEEGAYVRHAPIELTCRKWCRGTRLSVICDLVLGSLYTAPYQDSQGPIDPARSSGKTTNILDA